MVAKSNESDSSQPVDSPLVIQQRDVSSRLLLEQMEGQPNERISQVSAAGGPNESITSLLRTENATHFAGKHLAELATNPAPDVAESLWTKLGHIHAYSERTLTQVAKQHSDLTARRDRISESVNYDLNGTLQPMTFTDSTRQV